MRAALRSIAPRAGCALVVGAMISGPAVARASDPAAAEALFEDARRLMAEGHYSEACPKLEESLRLDGGIGARFNLADCNEHEGKIASAWAGYKDVAATARASGQEARATAARARAERLEPRLTTLTLLVGDDAPLSLRVERDGAPVGRGQWGIAVPVDPGEHVLTATADGRTVWRAKVRVAAEQPPTPLFVKVRTAEAGARDDASLASPSESPTSSLAQARAPTRGDGQRIAALATSGIGLAALGVGAGFGLHSMAEKSGANGHCLGNACDGEGLERRQSAVTAGNFSTAFVGVGAVALVTGAVLWFTAPRVAKVVGALAAVPRVGPQGATLSFAGAW